MPALTTFVPPVPVSFGNKIQICKWSWIADSGTGAVAAKTSTVELHGYLVKFKVHPGTTAPTALFDITLKDSDGCDVLGGEGADRSATLIEQGLPLVGAAYAPSRVDGFLTFAITGNSVNGATGDFYIYIEVD